MQLHSRSRFYRITIPVACGSKDDELQVWRLEEKSVCGKTVSVPKDWKRASANRLAGRIAARWFASGDLSPVSPRSLPQRALVHPLTCSRGSRATSLRL